MAERTTGGDGTHRVPADGGGDPRLSRRSVLAMLTATGIGSAIPSQAGATLPGDSRHRSQTDDGTGPIEDVAWVETDVDTNDSGEPDRVHVRVSRPESTADGQQLPVVATISPYYGEQTHSDATPEMYYERSVAPAAGAETGRVAVPAGDSAVPSSGHRTSAIGGNAVHRHAPADGYVNAQISSLGTHRSTGCYTAAGPPTIAALESVIDWFNGRATAYDAQSGGDPVEADWTNGRTGLIGGSANGELANGLATTGVDGLEAIVAKAANNGQYSLFRSTGTPISPVPDETEGITDLGTWIQAGNALRPACAHWRDRVEAGQDRRTGDYNDFWHEREFLPKAEAVDCAVLLSGAVDDPIVKPNNVADWYEMLDRADVPLRLWLHKGGHSSPRSPEWRELVERWWDHWLKDGETGVMDEPPVTVNHGGASSADGSLDTYPSWPVPSAEPVRLQFGGDGTSIGAMHVDPQGSADAASFVDAPSVPLHDLLPSGDPTHRLRYETPPVWKGVQVSGKVVPSLSVSLEEPTVISAALVESNPSGTDVVARGWADPLNRPAHGEYDSPVAYKQSLRESRPLSAGEQVRVEFPLQATDHVFDPGSRLGLVVYASDREFTLHPPGNATVSVDIGASSVAVPVAGGGAELADAFREEQGRGTSPSSVANPATKGTDGAGPGFGIGSALAAIGGVVRAVCRRRPTGDERRE